MDDFEWIEKEDVVEEQPKEVVAQPSALCQDEERISDQKVPTSEKHVAATAEDIHTGTPMEGSSPQKEDESLQAMEQELDDDLCVLNLHHLVLVGRIARQLGAHAMSYACEGWSAMRQALNDGAAEDAVRSHGVSFAAAAVTLVVSLLLVHRQEQGVMLSSTTPSSMVSIARSGAQCSALPAAVLVLTHNFTAAQRMQGAAPPAPTVLEVHAKDVMEHYELARSLFKKGASERHVHGHRAQALQRKAAKELKKTSKWAARELHSLVALHRRFMRDAHDAARLERDAMDIIVDQLPSLVNALSEKDVYVLRRVLRSLSHVTSKSEATAEAMRISYKGAVKGLAYVASALDSHWQRVGPALQSAVESELASRKASLEALALASCLPSLEQQIERDLGAPASDATCPPSPVDALVSQLHASLTFQQRLIKLIPPKAGEQPSQQGQHEAAVAACERSGGLAITLQRRHADLTALVKRHQTAAAA